LDTQQIAKARNEMLGLDAAEKAAVADSKKLNESLNQTGKEGAAAIKSTATELNGMTSIARSGAGILAAYFSLTAINAFKDRLIETTIKFEGYNKAIQFASGNAENFAKNQQFLNDLIRKYGLALAQTTEAYKSFFTASTLAGQSQKETNRQFEAVTKAGTVLKLTADQMQGAFLALGQMMSKGTVQAEELRGQLGERIPGAFSIMAKALNVNERQLNKMLEQGQVLSKEALPAFAKELEKTFGPESEKNLNGMVNSQNRFNSAIDNLILAIGNKLQPFLKGSYDLAAGIANQLAGIGQAAKKETVENIALKKTESDIAKKIFDVSIQQNVEITRRRAASELLLEIDKKIEEQFVKNANFRIQAAGAVNDRAKIDLERGLRKLAILQEQETLLTQIAGVEVEGGKVKKELTDAELKALKEQYDLRLRLLELDRKEKELLGTLANDPNARLQAEQLFLNAKLGLQKEFATKGAAITEQEIRITGQEFEIATKELNARYKAQEMQLYKESEADIEKRRQQAEDAKAKSMDKTVADNKKMMSAIDQQSEEFHKKELARIERQRQLREEAIRQAFGLAQDTTNALFNIQSQYDQNEYNQKVKRFDEETRLAGENAQKLAQIEERRAAADREYRIKQFKANQQQAIANAAFQAAPYIIEYTAGLPLTAANLTLTLGALAAQTALILAQPVPEFAEGTKGKPFKGTAIVGEKGTEKVITESGKVYFTPGVATLAQFDEPVQIIPNNQLGLNDKQALSLVYANSTKKDRSGYEIVSKLDSIEKTLSKMPVAAISLDERGFIKAVKTQNRTTTLLNNRFRNK